MHASIQGKHESVGILMKYDAKLDTQEYLTGYSPLIMATELGYRDTVRALLECGAQVDQQDNEGMSALANVSMNGHNEIVKLLLLYYTTKQMLNSKIMMYAASNGHIETVKILTNCRALVCQRDNDGMSALMHATTNGHIEAVKILMKHGAVVDQRNNNGNSAFSSASKFGHREIVRILLAVPM